MVRPLFLDILSTAVPLGVGVFVFVCSRRLVRAPRSLRYGAIALGLLMLVVGAGMLWPEYPPELRLWLSWIGGATILLGWVALLFLGIVWNAPNRSLSSGFLGCLVVLAGFLLVVESSGWMLWRFLITDTWDHNADGDGCLRQSSGMTCSPAAAVMLLHHHGIEAGEGEMAYLANTSIFGTEAHAMAQAVSAKVQERGWHAEARVRSYDDCVRQGRPFVAHIRTKLGGHAIFVEKIDDKRVRIVDPKDGQRVFLPRIVFEKAWRQIVIEIHKSSE